MNTPIPPSPIPASYLTKTPIHVTFENKGTGQVVDLYLNGDHVSRYPGYLAAYLKILLKEILPETHQNFTVNSCLGAMPKSSP